MTLKAFAESEVTYTSAYLEKKSNKVQSCNKEASHTHLPPEEAV